MLERHSYYIDKILDKFPEIVIKIYDFVYYNIIYFSFYNIIVIYGLLRSIFGLILFIINIKNKKIIFKIKYDLPP
jgi:hypothetical protein